MTKPQVVIALSGPKECGKDTVADLLVTHAGFRKLAFADALYNEVAAAYQIDPRQLRHRETKEHPLSCLALEKCLADGFLGRLLLNARESKFDLDLSAPRSPRQILQWWGTEYRRHIDKNYWVRQLAGHIHYQTQQRIAHRFVITDCRFDNEADMVRAHGGLIWQVKRPGREVPEGAHVSEVTGEAFNPDAVINNSHDIKHLQQLVMGEFWAHDAGLAGVKVEITV